jgi:replicative DNA helicase
MIVIIQKNERLAKDIAYLARSLGFGVTECSVEKTCTNSNGINAVNGRITKTYHRISIYGKGLEEIPVVVPRKKTHERKQIKDVLVSRLSFEKLKVDKYYGFSIDGNKRFLLKDCTVVCT